MESTREEGEGEALTFEVGAGDVFANEMIKASPPVMLTASVCLDDLLGSVQQLGTRVCRRWTQRCGAWRSVTQPGWK